MPGSEAKMSPTRGTTRDSPCSKARRSAFETTSSMVLMGKPLRDTGALVDLLVFACGEGDLLDDLADVMRDFDGCNRVIGGLVAAGGPRFLLGNRDGFVDRLRVVRADF